MCDASLLGEPNVHSTIIHYLLFDFFEVLYHKTHLMSSNTVFREGRSYIVSGMVEYCYFGILWVSCVQ